LTTGAEVVVGVDVVVGARVVVLGREVVVVDGRVVVVTRVVAAVGRLVVGAMVVPPRVVVAGDGAGATVLAAAGASVVTGAAISPTSPPESFDWVVPSPLEVSESELTEFSPETPTSIDPSSRRGTESGESEGEES